MDHDDPEKRISELERRLADPRAVDNPGDNQFPFTSGQVHNVAFSDASRGRGYHRDQVDAFVDRVEATLRDPTARGGVYPADLDDVAFSKPPIGKLGYSEAEVDRFLDRVKADLSGRVPGQGPEEPIRCLLYRYASSDQQTPVLAIDVGKDALRVVDLNGNALIASVSVAEVTAQPGAIQRDSRADRGRTRFGNLDHHPAPTTGSMAHVAQVEEARLPCRRG
jgi:DivIVA domain-containing protein